MGWLDRFGGKRDVVDLRSDAERERERRAKSELSGEDEQLARKLVTLIGQAAAQYGSDAYEATAAEITQIGERLCANGGSDRMAQVAYRVQALGARVRDCELYRDGVCGWSY